MDNDQNSDQSQKDTQIIMGDVQHTTEPQSVVPQPKSKKKIFVIIAIVVTLAISGVAAYMLTRRNSPLNKGNSPAANTAEITAASLNSVFNYASINDVEEFDGYTWVALGSGVVRYNDKIIESYDQTDGLDGPAAKEFVVFEGQLWVSTTNGVSRYLQEQNTFKPYFTDVTDDAFSGGIGNVNLFVNTVGNVLSVSSFKDFYEHIPERDTFASSTGPKNTDMIYFNDNEGVAISWEGDTSSVLYTYEAGSGWSRKLMLTDYRDQEVHVRKVADRFVIFGRAVKFENCDSLGSVPATLFNEYRSGTLSLLPQLNKQFDQVLLHPGDSMANYAMRSLPCDDVAEKAYDLAVESGEIRVVEVENPIEPYGPEAKQPYLDIISELKERLGREPIFHVIGVESDGSLITLYSDGVHDPSNRNGSLVGAALSSLNLNLPLNRLATVDEGRFRGANKIGQVDLMEDSTTATPVLCKGSLTYMTYVSVSGYDDSIYGAKLYEVQNGSQVEVADLEKSLKSSEAPRNIYCSDTTLQWISGRDIVSYDRKTKKLSNEKIFNEDRFGIALVGDKLWVSANTYTSAPLGYRDMKTGVFTPINLGVDYGTENEPKSNSLIGINETYIWMVLNGNPYSRVVAFTFDGSRAYEYELSESGTSGYAYSSSGTLTGSSKMILTIQGSWSTYEGFLLFDASTQTAKKLKPTIPVRGDLGSLIYNPLDNLVWVNAGNTLFSFKAE